MKSSYFRLFSVFLISCLGVFVYSNAFHASFHLDDRSSIIDNPAIRDFLNLASIWSYLPRRFLLYLSIALNYHFNGLDVLGYHVFNLAVHVLTAILVWWLSLLTLSTPSLKDDKMTGHANLIALLAGLVFVAHPVQTQAVTYIVQRAASMAALFYVASLCFYVQSRLLEGQSSARVYFGLSLVAAVAAMFTKETAITLPVMIVLYEIFFFKTQQSFKWGYCIPFLFIFLTIPLTMLMTETGAVRLHQLQSEPGISSVHYLLTQFRVMLTYIRLVFVPFNQNLDYDYAVSNSLFEIPSVISLLVLMAILFGAKQLYSKYRLISFSIFWFFLTLLPESSVMPIKDVIFEHRLYLPMVGFSLFLVSALWEIFGRKALTATVIALAVIVTCNGVLTYQRNKVWKDEFSLWDDTVRKSPHKARPYNNRGNAYNDLGQFDQALPDYDEAIELNPEYAEAYYNRGGLYAKQNKLTQALSDLNRSIMINPRLANSYNNRGNVYSKQGKFNLALIDLNKAIEINPYLAEAYNNRGSIYDKQGKFAAAILDYRKALELDPHCSDAYNNLGIVNFKRKNIAEAISDYNKALEINSNDAEAYDNRGLAYESQGNLTQAINDYSQAIDIAPSFSEGYSNRGNAYFKENKLTEALVDYSKVIALNGSDLAVVYYNRGLIYDKLGNSQEALSDYTKAIKLNPNYAKAYYNRGYIFDNQNKFAQAISDYTKAIDIEPRYAQAYDNRGNVYEHSGDFTRAIADFTKAIALDPQFAIAYSNRGGAYGNLGDLTQAIADCTKAIEINPRLAQAFSNRAGAYYLAKEFDKAMADVQKSQDLGYPINPGLINALKQALSVNQ